MKNTIIGYASKEDMNKLMDLKELTNIFVWADKNICHDLTVTVIFTKKDPPLWYSLKVKLRKIWKIIKE